MITDSSMWSKVAQVAWCWLRRGTPRVHPHPHLRNLLYKERHAKLGLRFQPGSTLRWKRHGDVVRQEREVPSDVTELWHLFRRTD